MDTLCAPLMRVCFMARATTRVLLLAPGVLGDRLLSSRVSVPAARHSGPRALRWRRVSPPRSVPIGRARASGAGAGHARRRRSHPSV
jgi:hypothetical protein